MPVAPPILSGTIPEANSLDVLLRPSIRLEFVGPGLIDPRSFSSSTFAVYGPGDLARDSSGPGTILDSAIISDPYRLLDGVVTRELTQGTYALQTSGLPIASGIVIDGRIGVAATKVYAWFTPDTPLNADTSYTAVLVGEDALNFLTTSEKFPGITTWTSEANFAPSGSVVGSGTLEVTSSYTRTLPTANYDSDTAYNDTFRIEITSGSTIGVPNFWWSKTSSLGLYAGAGASPHSLGDGLAFAFSGTFVTGDVYLLDTYAPQPLAASYSFDFATGPPGLSGVLTPPITTPVGNLVIDETALGGFGVSSSSTDDTLYVVSVTPAAYDYGVDPDLSVIVVEFNKPLASISPLLSTDALSISLSPMLGIASSSDARQHEPQLLETSGNYLKIWL